MPAWKTIRIFISSTFRDMHSERDHLVGFVFPELKERCAKRQLHLVDVDLRWGVTEEESKRGSALEICLDEIERCRPFFIGLLGERYGWVPSSYDVPDEPQYRWLLDYEGGHSVTALEIYQGVLRNPEIQNRAFFYFRDPAFLSSVPEALQNDFRPETPEAERKLRALKDEIEAHRQVFKNYPCRYRGIDEDGKVRLADLEAFGQEVLNDLWSAINLEYPESATQSDDLAIERSYHEAFVEERAGGFIGRNDLLGEITTRVEGGAHTLVVTGTAGCGKSALLAKFSKEYPARNQEAFVLTHFIGVSPGSTDIRRTLLRLCRELKQQFALDDEIPTGYYELRSVFPDLLRKAAAHTRLVLIIDALNQLNESHSAVTLDWLPHSLPPDLTLIVSTLEGDCLDELRRRTSAPLEVAVGPLTEGERKEIVRQTLWTYRKRLDERADNNQLGTLLSKRDSNNPLYLRVACEELRVFGDFESVTQQISSLPDDLPTLFEQVLERAERDHEPAVVTELLSLLVCARQGLLESELLELLAPPGQDRLPPTKWAGLYRCLKFYLRPPGEQGEGGLDFFHQQLAQAARQRYFITSRSEAAVHQRLAAYFRRRVDPDNQNQWTPDYPRGLSELPFHLLQGQAYEELYQLARDGRFLAVQAQAFPDDPNLQMDTLRQAIEAAIRGDHATEMAEFSLSHALRLTELAEESPLAALRAGNLRRSWELADLHTIEHNILWHLLLAWELSDTGRKADGQSTLDRLCSKGLLGLSGWQGEYAAHLLLEMYVINEDATNALQQQLLTDDDRIQLCQQLIEVGHFQSALEIERDIKKEHSFLWTHLVRMQAQAGDFKGAVETFRRVRGAGAQVTALVEVASAQAQAGERIEARATFARAVEIVSDIEEELHQVEALAEIATAQAKAGNYEDARTNIAAAVRIIPGIEDEAFQAVSFARVATAQAQVGDYESAQTGIATALEMAETIKSDFVRPTSFREIAVAQAHAGYFTEALQTVRHVGANVAYALKRIAEAKVQTGDLTDVLEAARNVNDAPERALAIAEIASVQQQAGEGSAALVTARIALDMSQAVTDKIEQASSLKKIAVVQAQAGKRSVARDTLAIAIQFTDRNKVGEYQSAALRRIAAEQMKIGENSAAQSSLAAASKAARNIQDELSGALELKEIAAAQLEAGHLSEARDAARSASEATRMYKPNSKSRQIETLRDIALLQAQIGDSTGSQATLIADLEIIRNLKKEWWRAWGLNLIATAKAQSGDFTEALELARSIEHREQKSEALAGIAAAQAQAAYFAEAIETYRTIECAEDRVVALIAYATRQAQLGSRSPAQGTLAVALETARDIEKVDDRASAFTKIAVAQAQVEVPTDAQATFVLAIETANEIEWDWLKADKFSEIAAAQARAGDPTSAFETTRKIKSDSHRASALLHIAAAQLEAGDSTAALATLAPALELARSIEVEWQRASALREIAIVLGKAGLGDRAVGVAETIHTNRAELIPDVAAALAETGDKEHFKRLLIPCAYYSDAAYRMCGLLARLYPEHADTIAQKVALDS